MNPIIETAMAAFEEFPSGVKSQAYVPNEKFDGRA
jgi:hypothetical protein